MLRYIFLKREEELDEFELPRPERTQPSVAKVRVMVCLLISEHHLNGTYVKIGFSEVIDQSTRIVTFCIAARNFITFCPAKFSLEGFTRSLLEENNALTLEYVQYIELLKNVMQGFSESSDTVERRRGKTALSALKVIRNVHVLSLNQ